MLDSTMNLPSYTENATGYGLTADTRAWHWDQYVPNPGDRSLKCRSTECGLQNVPTSDAQLLLHILLSSIQV